MTYSKCASTLSVGGIRQQFSIAENILLSLYGMEFMRNMHRNLCIDGVPPAPINFAPHGYLNLCTEEGHQSLKENVYVQRHLGARVKYLEKKALKSAYPWLNCDDLAAGAVGIENEGWFDPWTLLQGMRQKAIHLGANYVQGELCGIEYSQPMIGVIDEQPTLNSCTIHKVKIRLPDGTINPIECAKLIMATGSDTGRLCYKHFGMGMAENGLMAYPIPIEPRKRYVYTFHAPKGPGLATPMVVDPSGAYFRREGYGNIYLGGMSPPEDEEPPTGDLEVDHDYFPDKIWPIIAHRVPGFEELKVVGSWAGNYEYNYFDQNGIVGAHPYITNVYMAAGFSGHGIQHSPGVGRGMAELILEGDYETIDLSRFSPFRLMTNQPIYEQNCV